MCGQNGESTVEVRGCGQDFDIGVNLLVRFDVGKGWEVVDSGTICLHSFSYKMKGN